ncbi:hypothetical protein SDC9_47245 [bioreactor metagenome]|uniref:Uncharacterized protein n=1 Tax=bioreactor metagenome TaxID=1076179 RepID=A0A644WBX2_9ZZZZ
MDFKKNRLLTVLLLVITLIIWSIIVYKIYDTIYGVEDIAIEKRSRTTAKVSDTIEITFNHRDPFLKQTNVILTNDDIPAKEEIKAPSFFYKGKIRKGKSELIIIENNGTLLYLKRDTIIDGFSIIKAFDDSLSVTKNGKVFILKF